MTLTKSFTLLFAVFLISVIALAESVPARQSKIAEQEYRIRSVFNGKYVTVTDEIYSPGPYTIYANIAMDLDSALPQTWTMYAWDANSTELHTVNGEFWNSITTYKASEDAFAVTNRWIIKPVEGHPQAWTLTETWTGLCLTNTVTGGHLYTAECESPPGNSQWFEFMPLPAVARADK